MTGNHWLMNPLLTGVFFELGLALFYQFAAGTFVQWNGPQRGFRLDYGSRLLQFFSIVYFSGLGIYFEYCAQQYHSDLAFMNFRILLISFLMFFSGARNNFEIMGLITISRLVFRGFTPDSLIILAVILVMFIVLQLLQRYLLRAERSGMATMLSIVAVIVWSFMHLYFRTSWGYIFNRLIDFFVMAIVLYLTVIILNRDNRELLTLSRTASFDSLTGVKNYYLFSTEFLALLKQAHRDQQPLTLVALDIDHFKHINDTYGHLAGNSVLTHLAQQLQAYLQEQDARLEIYRVGGEEFNIVAPGYQAEEMAAIMLACQKIVRQDPVIYHNQKIWVTISAGVTELRAVDVAVPTIYERADQNLYLSKGRGRDQVTVDGKTV